MIEYYVIKSLSHNPNTPTYMEALSVEHAYEKKEAMDDEIQSLMRRDTWEIVSRNLVSDHNVLPGRWSFKCKKKPDWNIRNSRHDILWEWMSRRDCIRNPWTIILQWSIGPQWGWCWFCSVFYVFRVKVLTSKMSFLSHIFQVGIQS